MKTKEYFIDLQDQLMSYHVQITNGHWNEDEGRYMFSITCAEATADGREYIVLQESDIPDGVYNCLLDMVADDIGSGYYDEDEFIEPDGVEL